MPVTDLSGSNEKSSRPDWGPTLMYWIEDGKADPNVDWPKDWEVCGWPDCDPLGFLNRDKRRHGNTCMAMPMYSVPDLVPELDFICSFLERMPDGEREHWLALQDRQLCFSCSEIVASGMERHGFHIPGPLLHRICELRIRLMIGFHPASGVIYNVIY